MAAGILMQLVAVTVLVVPGFCSSPFAEDNDDLSRAKRATCYPQDDQQTSYTYVVVGGGVAGCIVASRLSEDPQNTVLLLEAGSDVKTINNLFPFFFPNLVEQPIIDYNFTSVRQNRMCLSQCGLCDQARGCKMGGSSFIKYGRGSCKGFNLWESMGNPTWGWNSVLPWFQKVERCLGSDCGSLGRNGLIPLSTNDKYWLTPYLLTALSNDMNLPRTHLVDGLGSGSDSVHVTVEQGELRSPVDTYLRPVLNRPNLCVLTDARVTSLVISNLRAEGATFMYKGTSYTAKASRAVVLSAGVFGSPQLLMLSGIGPEDHLTQLGIPVKKNLPGVGLNLVDHPAVLVEFNMTNVLETDDCAKAATEYLYNRSGIYALPESRLQLVSALISSSYASPDYPDLFIGSGGGSKANVIKLNLIVTLPYSRGSVRLASSCPYDKPLIDPNYYEVDSDFDRMRQALDFGFRFVNSPTLSQLGVSSATYRSENQPICVNSTDLYACLITNYGESANHPVGTCKMGPASDPMSVVDWKLKVHGVDGLYVVDASIMPTIPNESIVGAVMMTAEKGSAFIKEECLAG